MPVQVRIALAEPVQVWTVDEKNAHLWRPFYQLVRRVGSTYAELLGNVLPTLMETGRHMTVDSGTRCRKRYRISIASPNE